jgi:hypothetical protein
MSSVFGSPVTPAADQTSHSRSDQFGPCLIPCTHPMLDSFILKCLRAALQAYLLRGFAPLGLLGVREVVTAALSQHSCSMQVVVVMS